MSGKISENCLAPRMPPGWDIPYLWLQDGSYGWISNGHCINYALEAPRTKSQIKHEMEIRYSSKEAYFLQNHSVAQHLSSSLSEEKMLKFSTKHYDLNSTKAVDNLQIRTYHEICDLLREFGDIFVKKNNADNRFQDNRQQNHRADQITAHPTFIDPTDSQQP
ncbi:hypothetical protein Trydic_g13656 [Trypoxylus dichotomus]